MHSTNLPPAGKAMEVDTSRPDGVYLTARIVEPTAVKLVKEGVYSAFSVGISKPRIIRDKVAKNGRVVDGVFSEVSVVDFPALPSAKFTVVKRAKDEIEKLEKSLTPVGTLYKMKGTDSVAELPENLEDTGKAVDAELDKSATECEVCKGAGCDKCMTSEVAKAASDCKTCEGSGKIMEGNRDCPDCGGNAMSSDVEKKGKIPDDDEEVTENLKEADEAIEEAQAAQEEDNAKHEAGMPEEDDDDEEESKKALAVDLTYAIRRAHDASCPAYSHNVVESVHPSVAKFGIKGVIDPEIVRNAITASASSATFNPAMIRNLTEAFDAAVKLADTPDGEINAAHDVMNKAFAEDYPTAKPTPGNVTPGEFKRPYIGAGRAPSSSTGTAPSIPFEGGNDMHASEFSRDLITDGREHESPKSSGSWPSETVSAADQLTSMARDHALVSLQNLHDHIATAYPDICALDTSSKPSAGIGQYAGTGIETMDMSGSLNNLKTTAAVPTIEKSDKIEDGDTIVAEVQDGQQVLIDTEVLTSLVKTIMADQLSIRFEEMNDALKEVQTEVQKMASEPDPAQAPIRGTVTVERASVQKSVTEADMLREKAESDLTAQVDYLQTLSKSGNPELRMRAQGQLEKLFERASMSVDS